MKYFLITITSLILLSGCSYQNAFSKFEMSKKEELLASNTQSSKIVSKKATEGIVTAIYLNNVDPKHREPHEIFLVSVYMKNSDHNYNFKLNGLLAVDILELSNIEFYSDFIKNPREWDTYYLVKFKKSKRKINFTLEGNKFTSSALHYLKDPL